MHAFVRYKATPVRGRCERKKGIQNTHFCFAVPMTHVTRKNLSDQITVTAKYKTQHIY